METVYESGLFRVSRQDRGWVQVEFLYDGADGPTPSSKSFTDAAARQILEIVRGNVGANHDRALLRLCSLSRSEVVRGVTDPQADCEENTAPGPKAP